MTAHDPLNIFEIDGRAPADLYQVAWAFRQTRALYAAEQYGVFGPLLEGSATAPEVALACGLHPEPTEKLLVLLAAMGLLFRTSDGSFRATRYGRLSFDPTSPVYFGDAIGFAREAWMRWAQFDQYLQTGRRMEFPPTDEHFEGLVKAMHDGSVRGQAQWLANNVDLSERTSLLDFGGAVGTYSIAFCQRYSELRAVVFDRAGTEPYAVQNIARFGMADRVRFRAGDWNTDEVPPEFDVALLSNVLHGHQPRQRSRLERARQALIAGGLLVVQDFLLDNDRNGPLEAAAFNLHLDANTIDEMVRLIEAAGFRDVRLVGRGPYDSGVVTGIRQ